jgi:hypothetical protein
MIAEGIVQPNFPPNSLCPCVAMLRGVLDVEGQEVPPLVDKPTADVVCPVRNITTCPAPNVFHRSLTSMGVGHATEKHDESQTPFNGGGPGGNVRGKYIGEGK